MDSWLSVDVSSGTGNGEVKKEEAVITTEAKETKETKENNDRYLKARRVRAHPSSYGWNKDKKQFNAERCRRRLRRDALSRQGGAYDNRHAYGGSALRPYIYRHGASRI